MPPIVAGLKRLTGQLQAVGYQFTVEDLIKGADIILARAQTLCPVDTGTLRESGYVSAASDEVTIGFDVEYASYVEFGTYKMEAQPYLRPALDEAEEDALMAIVDSIESHWTKEAFDEGLLERGIQR